MGEELIDSRLHPKKLAIVVKEALKETKYRTFMTVSEYKMEVFLRERDEEEAREEQIAHFEKS